MPLPLPTCTASNPSDRCSTDTELCSDLSVEAPLRNLTPYLVDHLVGQSGPRIPRTGLAESPVTSLGLHIGEVVGLSTHKEVIRSHARGRVAVMQHAQSVRYGPIAEFPREAVSPDITTVDPELPVTVFFPAKPQPAALASLDLRPEACFRAEHVPQYTGGF